MAKPLPTIPDSRPASPLSTALRTPRDELARALSPLVAVAASQDAEELCQINHIPSVADFIKPFGDTIEGRVSPRDWQGIPIAVDNFSVRFQQLDKLNEPNQQAVLSVINDYVRSRHPESLYEIKSPADVNDAYLDTSLDDIMPWYADFRRLMLSLRGITEHETFDHPVAVMIVISSSNPDPMGTITQLYNPNIPSFTVDRPYVDPNILRYYVLLHDPHRASEAQAQETFEKMRKSLGLHCHLLRINSKERPPETAHLLDDDAAAIEPDADPAVCDIWQQQLTEAYAVESRLQAYAASPSIQSEPAAPSSSSGGGGHTRSSSISSNVSSSPGLSSPSLPPTTLQTTPLEIGITSLENEQRQEQQQQQQHPMHPIVDDEQIVATVQYGRYMTQDDVDACKAMVRELVVQSMIPFMERNIQHWNEQVASARRGLTGRLFGASRRLFGSSSRTQSMHSLQSIPATGPNVPAGVNQLTVYPYGAPEAQMRKLADYAFMIRDYKFAHTIYDTVRRDYATDKAYKYHAGTQEMIGVCLLMMNQPLRSKADVDRNFELAVQQYLGRCRSPFQATRTTIMYYELLKAHRMWKEVPTSLVRMTGEDSDLRSALFLEQAAHCFLRTSKPMVRKYGFHVVMAAHRYGKALQREHALRCYQLAAMIFDDRSWSIAKSHIQFALGRQAFHLGLLEDAATYFANVLADAKQTPQQQAAHVREFMFIYRQYTSSNGIDPLEESLPSLGLPVIDDQHVRVSLSNAQAINTDNQEEWASMERELLEQNIAKGYIYGSKKALALQQQHDNRVTCAIGEPTIVHIEVSNPLQIAIQINDLILGCEHRESIQPFKEARSPEAEAYDTMVHGTFVEGSDDMFAFGSYELQKISEITLEPMEKRWINLAIVPRKEGSILVKGLHYTFNGLVHRFYPIVKKGKRLNDTIENRRTVAYAQDHTLDILVTSPMPLLDLQFHHVPESILSGEVVQTVLEINNKGNKGLTALRLKTSHPSFICIGNPEDMDRQIYGGGNDPLRESVTLDNKLYDPSVMSVPLPKKEGGGDVGVVNSGETTLVPLWIRGDRIGKHTFKFLFSYQSEEDDAAIAHRTLRYTLNVQVLASLKINAFTRPSAASVSEYILGIEIENLQTVAAFQLTQLNAASPLWSIVPLSIRMDSKQDIEAKTSIPPRQTTFAYYKLSKLTVDEEPSKPIDLNVSKLAFTDAMIPFDSVPLKTFALNSRMQWRNVNIQTHYPHVPPEEYNDQFGLYNPGDVDLTLYWDIPNMKRHGHHYIIGINLSGSTLNSSSSSSSSSSHPSLMSLHSSPAPASIKT